MISLIVFSFTLIVIYIVEYKINRPIIRAICSSLLLFITINVSIFLGTNLESNLQMSAYSRGFSILTKNLYKLSLNKEYDRLQVHLKFLSEQLPFAVNNISDFNSLINKMQSIDPQENLKTENKQIK